MEVPKEVRLAVDWKAQDRIPDDRIRFALKEKVERGAAWGACPQPLAQGGMMPYNPWRKAHTESYWAWFCITEVPGNEKSIEQQLYEHGHAISNAAAKALEEGRNVIPILLETVGHLVRHVKALEEFTQYKAAHEVTSIVLKPGEVVAGGIGKMKSTTVYLTEEQLAALQEHSARSGVPIAATIRRGVDLALAELKEKEEYQKKGVANR